MSQLSDSTKRWTPTSRQPMSIDFSCDQDMLETQRPTSKERRNTSLKRRKMSLSRILFQISFYVIDIINFNPLFLHHHGNHKTKCQIFVIYASHRTCFQFKFLKSINFCKNDFLISQRHYFSTPIIM